MLCLLHEYGVNDPMAGLLAYGTAFAIGGLTFIGGLEEAFAGSVRGKVVTVSCSFARSGYVNCRSTPLQTTVDVAFIEVDGSVSRRSIATNRSGHFRLKLASGYYEFAPRPPELGMQTTPVEITVPPEGVAITLKVDAGNL
jgi:hypothetical protein